MIYSRSCGQARQSIHVKLPSIRKKWGIKSLFSIRFIIFLYIDRKPGVSSLRWYAVYKDLFSGFKVILSLTTRSRQKFGKKT